MNYFVGIDVSTTATKAVMVDDEGNVVASASSPYALSTPRPLWAEQDPAWWEAACYTSIREVLETSAVDSSAVQAIGLTGQMHGLVLLDEAGEVLRPAILWNDQRASVQCDAMRNAVGRENLLATTGNDATAGLTAPKLLWVRDHEPEVYRRIHQVLLPKDYVRYCLTADYATDRAGAGGTLLLDLHTRDWSEDLLDILELPPEWFPRTHEGPEITGLLSAQAAHRTGLRAGTPVVAGAGDQAAQAVGVGAVEPGAVSLTLGTSGVVFAPCAAPLVDGNGRLNAFPHAVPGIWHLMGVMLSAAGSLRWYRDVVAPTTGFDALLSEASSIEAGSEGLVFLPYLSGERCPHPDPTARACFVGLTLRHGRGHMTRSVLEGVAFGLRDNLDLLRATGVEKVSQILVSGGGVRNPFWRQLLADVLDVNLVTSEEPEGAAYGAALLAAVGTGTWSSVSEACSQAVTPGEVTTPDPSRVPQFAALHERFREHYPQIRPLFRETA